MLSHSFQPPAPQPASQTTRVATNAQQGLKPHQTVTLVFAAVSAVWIIVSDLVIAGIATSAENLALLQSLNGLAYVVSTAAILYLAARKANVAQRRREMETVEVYKATVAGAYHILGNYLNASQLVELIAQEDPEFDRQALAMAKRARADAVEALAKLRDVNRVCVEEIATAVREGTPKPWAT